MNQTRPNILWICTDQQRYDTIAALGYPAVSTPVVDRLVQQGVAFDRAFCQCPICTPSRASFLTGTYPSVTHNNRNGNESFVARYPLVTRIMADAGYDFTKPPGAFYLFPRTPIPDDVEFVQALQEELILAVPGSGFGGPGYFRIAYCVDDETIVKALPGFKRVMQKFR